MTRRDTVRALLRMLAGLMNRLADDSSSSDAHGRGQRVKCSGPVAGEAILKDILGTMRLELHETARAVLMCFTCNKLVPIEQVEGVVRSALLGSPPNCSECGNPVDVWKNTLFAMTAGGLAIAAQVGARHTAIMYPLGVGETATFDIRDKGVPTDAIILRVAHTARLADGVAIVDLDATDSARVPGFQVHVLGVRLAEGNATDMQAQTTVTWAHHDTDDHGRRSLNRALLAIADGRLDEAIIPANVAVEVTLAAVLREHLRAVGISGSRVDPFLTDAAAYSHQLNVLLPLVLTGTGAPPMHETLRGTLNRLRGLRNDVGHRGKPKAPLTREVVGECVAGAVFGFYYARLAAEFLAEHRLSLGTT